MQVYQNVAQDVGGNAVAGVSVTVFITGTLTKAVLFSDNGVTPLANPFINSSDGSFRFYTANGRYDIVLAKANYTFSAVDLSDILVYDRAGLGMVNIKDFGAKGDGIADDTTALTTAIANAQSIGGDVILPSGVYRITSTVVIGQAVRIIGQGAGVGGNTTAGNDDSKSVVIDHDFVGDLFQIVGVNGNVLAGVGSALDNLILRQINGNGTGASGKCISVVKASDTFAPSWIKISRLAIEVATGKNDWSIGIELDGSAAATGPSAGGGLRDTVISDVRITSGANASQSVVIRSCGNVWMRDVTCNLSKAIVLVTGPSVAKASGNVNMSNVGGDTLSLDQVLSGGIYGGVWGTYQDTANTTGIQIDLANLTNTPTFNAINSHLFVGKLGVTGAPSIWTSNGLEYRSGLVQFRAGVTANFGTVDAQALSLFSNGSTALRLENDQNARFQSGFVPKLTRPAYGATVTLNILTAKDFWVTVTNGTAFTVVSNGSPYDGQEITIWISNQSGGAMGAITWPGQYKMSAWTNPATGQNRSITLVFDTTTGNWHETNRTPNDVPN